MEYKDYYQLLGVERTASADEIKKSYRKLAAKFHPDRHRGDKHFEEKFKEINEAYDVLGDPEKRKQYDLLGSNWRAGQQVNPDDFANVFGGAGHGRRAPGGAGGPGGGTFTFDTGGGAGGFSDFFEALFGGMGGAGGRRGAGGRGAGGTGSMFEGFGGAGGEDPFAQMRGEGGRAGHARRPQAQATGDHLETSVTITLEEAYRGTTRRLAFQRSDGAGGAGGTARQDYDVKIPAGIREGQKVRLKGQGGGTQVGGYGDILITIHLAADARYQLEGDDLVTELPLAPWEAALGARVTVTTLDGPLEVKVPAAIRSGQRMRVRGRGWPKKGGEKGDMLLRVAIQVPPKLTTQEQELFEKLQVVSSFNPRG